MVNPLRFPIVLVTVIAGMMLFVHLHRDRDSISEADSSDQHELLTLRKDPLSFPSSDVRTDEVLQPDDAVLASPALPAPENAAQRTLRPPLALLAPEPNLTASGGQIARTEVPPPREPPRKAPPREPLFSRPPADPATVPAAAASRVHRPELEREPVVRMHRIVDGDTLRRLSETYLGNGSRELEIFELNRDVLLRPDLLPLGQKIKIPPE